MSADLLREAAAKMRLANMAVRRPYGRDEMFKSAVADWLEGVASGESSGNDLNWPHPRDAAAALTVARVYLGSDQ